MSALRISLMAALPAVAPALLYGVARTRGVQWRRAILLSATVWGLLIVVITESLTIPRWLTRAGLGWAWLIADLLLAVIWLGLRLRLRWRRAPGEGNGAAPAPWGLTDTDAGLLAAVGLILGATGMVAVLAPPNTVDVMTYHLPRVVYWIQNHSVEHYATSNLKQLYMAPGAEYAMLQFHLLGRGDGADNLVQWLAFLGSIVGVSYLACLFGAKPRGQVLAAAVCAAIPEGILEASGSKNDWVTALWMVAFCCYLAAFGRDRGWVNVAGMGAALGLACLTKPTAMLFAPWLVAAFFCSWPSAARRSFLRRGVVAGALVLFINTGYFARNWASAGSPFWRVAMDKWKLTNDRYGAGITGSNLIRNVAVHFGTPSPGVNRAIEGLAARAIGWMGQDPNDPQSTWYDQRFYVAPWNRHETLAGNPLHVLLSLILMVGLLLRYRDPELHPAVLLGGGLCGAFITFCAVLKWQPWHCRLELPLFVLGSAVLGVAMARLWPGWASTAAGFILLWAAAPYALENQIRPLLSDRSIVRQNRGEMYFGDRAELAPSYLAAADFVVKTGCKRVGLDSSMDPFEYPMLALLGAPFGGITVRTAGVNNESARLNRGRPEPGFCAVVCAGCAGAMDKWQQYAHTGGRVSTFGDVAVFAATGKREAKPEPCSVVFSDGWHSREGDSRNWWRWSDGQGTMRVFWEGSGQARLNGELMSAVIPNRVLVSVNGTPTGEVKVDGITAPVSLDVSLRKGENRVVFRGMNPPVRPPQDPRLLAIAVKNLVLSNAEGTAVCR